nr:hypothetical protein [Parashewanella curva]
MSLFKRFAFKIPTLSLLHNKQVQHLVHLVQREITSNYTAFNSLLFHSVFILALMLVPELAFADPISEGVDWVMQLLTNGIARSAALLELRFWVIWLGLGVLLVRLAVSILRGLC